MFGIENIAFHDITVNENKAWFYNIGYDAIFELDLDTGALQLEYFLPEFTQEQERFAYLAYYNNKLYLAPRRDTRICIYNFEDKSYTYIELDLDKYGYSNGDNINLFSKVYVFKDSIYFFPGRFHSIVKLNPEDNSLSYLDAWYDNIKKYILPDKEKFVIFNNIHINKNGCCILASWTSNFILEYDLENNNYSIKKTNLKDAFSDSLKLENTFYCMLKNSGNIYKLSENRQSMILCSTENDVIYSMYDFEKKICIVPRIGKNLLIFDLDSERFKVIKKFENDILKNNWNCYTNRILCAKKLDNNTLFLFENYTKEILIINVDTQEIRSLKMTIDEASMENIKKYKNIMIANNVDKLFETNVFNENKYYKADDFIKSIKRR